jgi:hypothetical protein
MVLEEELVDLVQLEPIITIKEGGNKLYLEEIT